MAKMFGTSIDLGGYEIRNVRAQVLGADPASPAEGQFWYRSDLQEWRLRKNGSTVSLGEGMTAEEVQDLVGAMLTGNTESGITATYDDSDGTIDLTVTDAPLLGGQSSAYHLARGNHTGTQAAGTISDLAAVVQAYTLDQFADAAADVGMGGNKITGLADGSAATDAVTFGQLSAIIEGRDWKIEPADATTTAALPAVTATTQTLTANANGALPAQDGVTLAASDTLLVRNQAAGAQNGIYLVTQVGNAGAPFILTRRDDANTAAELTDATILIDNGTTGKGDIYTFPAITTLGTTDATPAKTGEGNTVYTADEATLQLVGQQFSIKDGGVGATQLAAGVAGNGLTGGAGTALAVNVGTGLEISSDAVRIAAAAAGNGLTGGAGSALAVGAGDGISVAADAVAVDSTVARKYATALGGGSTSEVITHNLNTRDVLVQVRNNAAPYEEVIYETEATTVNTVTIRSGGNLPAGYRVIVHG